MSALASNFLFPAGTFFLGFALVALVAVLGLLGSLLYVVWSGRR